MTRLRQLVFPFYEEEAARQERLRTRIEREVSANLEERIQRIAEQIGREWADVVGKEIRELREELHLAIRKDINAADWWKASIDDEAPPF